jgi:riboflavin kinase/FMN adenylyltransferase
MSIAVTRLADADSRPRHVAIGTFDGVHLGHRAVIDDADTVLTFEPHPLSVLHPEAAPKLIMPFEIKRDVIEGLGAEELVVIRFDREFSSIEAEGFCEDILVRRLGSKTVSVGENFRFGKGARGDPEMLSSRSEFEIRALIAAGDVEAATRCLGAPPLLEETVVEGDGRGRELGFPTANLVPDDALVVPGHGVYAAFANGGPAAVNVGVRPTFETGRGLLVEAHLLDFDGDLYGRALRVAFVKRLRGERRFPGAEDLIAQMHRDVREAREVCASFSAPRPSGRF